jgi:hypothetical protein
MEQSAKRLRKPEGAAQPGEANLVWVAVRCLARCRVAKPHGRAVHVIAVSGACVWFSSGVGKRLVVRLWTRDNGKRVRSGCFGVSVDEVR